MARAGARRRRAGRRRSGSMRQGSPVPSRGRTTADPGRSRRSGDRGALRARRRPGVVDDPADRPVGQPGSSAFRRAQATVGRDASTCVTAAPAPRHRQRREARVGEQVQDADVPRRRRYSASVTCPASQRSVRGVLREETHLAGRPSVAARARQSAICDASTARRSAAGPVQPPSRSNRRSASAQRSGRRRAAERPGVRPVHEPVAEPLEPRAIADVDQVVVVVHRPIIAMMTAAGAAASSLSVAGALW